MLEAELLTREDLRGRGWSKLMLKTLLPVPDVERDEGNKLPTPLWSLATIAALETNPEIAKRLEATIQERNVGAANTARQKAGQVQVLAQIHGSKPAGGCNCAAAQLLADALMHRWAYDLALVVAGGDQQAAHAALGRINLDLERPGSSLAAAVREAAAIRQKSLQGAR